MFEKYKSIIKQITGVFIIVIIDVSFDFLEKIIIELGPLMSNLIGLIIIGLIIYGIVVIAKKK